MSDEAPTSSTSSHNEELTAITLVEKMVLELVDDPFLLEDWLESVDNARRYIPDEKAFLRALQTRITGERTKCAYRRARTLAELRVELDLVLCPAGAKRDLIKAVSLKTRYLGFPRTHISERARDDKRILGDRDYDICQAVVEAMPDAKRGLFDACESDPTAYAARLEKIIRFDRQMSSWSSNRWADRSANSEASSTGPRIGSGHPAQQAQMSLKKN